MSLQQRLSILGVYRASQFVKLFLVHGSVVEFGSTCEFDNHPRSMAIVNAANEGCICGGGVDGAISQAGGIRLEKARWALPIVEDHRIRDDDEDDDDEQDSNDDMEEEEKEKAEVDDDKKKKTKRSRLFNIRCPTGQAVLTGPNVFGELAVPYVIHAVGPNYFDYSKQDTPNGHVLLQSAYQASLDLAYQHHIQSVGFALLSAGIFKGPYLTLRDVLSVGLDGLQMWKPLGTRTAAASSSSSSSSSPTNPVHRSTTDKTKTNIMDDDSSKYASSTTTTTPSAAATTILLLPDVYLFGFTEQECKVLVDLCEERFEKLSQN